MSAALLSKASRREHQRHGVDFKGILDYVNDR